MVSTRGVKVKFVEGERVLCYEPDPTKAKVLYDSKVRDVIYSKDSRGRKVLEYLIHFQGWNSSWDRCVNEEYVLKDTAENRQLQKDLAERAQLQLGAYLYRRERKKHNTKTNEPVVHSSEDGSSGSPVRIDTEGPTSSSEDESSADEEITPVELTIELKEILEHDFLLINNKNKLLKLPAEPNVVGILETYWKYYVSNQLGLTEKPNTKHRQPFGANNTSVKVKPEDLQRNLNICKEMLDGLRVYFDFTLNDLLLYKKEQGQVETCQAVFSSPVPSVKGDGLKTELEEAVYTHMQNMDAEEDSFGNHHENESHHKVPTRRRGLRSGRSLDLDSSEAFPVEPPTKPSSSSVPESTWQLPRAFMWKLLPEGVQNQKPPPPSLVYGATHLTRLFVKLPELLNSCNMPDSKLKFLIRYFEAFIDFLTDHKEWFGDKFYIDA